MAHIANWKRKTKRHHYPTTDTNSEKNKDNSVCSFLKQSFSIKLQGIFFSNEYTVHMYDRKKEEAKLFIRSYYNRRKLISKRVIS